MKGGRVVYTLEDGTLVTIGGSLDLPQVVKVKLKVEQRRKKKVISWKARWNNA